MGSFFLHDDYRLPEEASALPFKKDSYSNQGIFENNPCFASIKKELGLDGALSSSCGDDDIYADNRARASPVVERLILQEIQNDITEHAANIGISIDPEQWSIEETRKWLAWVASVYNISDLSDFLLYDGATLCNFSEQEFILLTGSEDSGLKISAQLDLWKNAIKLTPSAGFYHFQQQQVMDCKFGTPQVRRDTGTPTLLAASCSWSTTNQSPATQTSSYPTMGQFSHTTTNEYPGYNSYPTYAQHPAATCYQQQQQQLDEVRYMPRPTIPLDRFGSFRAACQSESFSAEQSYQHYTNLSQSPNFSGMFQQSKATFQNKENSIKGFPDTLKDVPKEYISSLIGQKSFTVDPEESLKALAILSKPVHQEKNSSASATVTGNDMLKEISNEQRLEKVKEEPTESSSNQAATNDEQTTKPPRKKSSKHPIHLWEFLKQLLHEGKDCIRWVDQEKGVFKIYNSQQVAKFWGERKNRPAMNYDKLSRSIRQYYKKGIIKKTSQGKRLVYQFCDGYL